MSQIPITNDNKTPRKVAGRTIMPGATAYFDEHTLPPHLRPGNKVKKENKPENPLLVMLELSIKGVTEKLPTLSDDQLDEIELLEVANADRAGMAKAIQEERLRRADLKVDGADADTGSDDSTQESDAETDTDGEGSNDTE